MALDRGNPAFTRRRFLTWTVGLAASFPLLQACQPQVVEKPVEVTRVVEKPVERIVEKPVEKIVEKTVQVTAVPAAPGELVVPVLTDAWMCDSMALLPAIQRYNEKYKGKVRIDATRTPQGWETKALQMVREGNPAWNAKWHMTQFWDMRRFVETGLIQPVEDLIKGSKTTWATKYKETTTPQVFEASLYKGKQYLVSDYVSRNVVSYRTDYLQKAGWKQPPETWEEFTACARDLKKSLPKDVVPIGLTKAFYRSVGSTFLGFVNNREEAYDKDDKVLYTSDKFFQVLQMFKGWFDEKLTTLDAWNNEDDYMLKGMVAMHIGAEYRVPTVRKIWGQNLIDAVNIPVPKKGMPPRCYWEADGPVIFRNAKQPQEAFDWAMEMLAWDGEVAKVWQEFAAYNFGLLTPYPDLNKKLFTGKPEHEWLVKSEEMVKNSWITPRNVSFLIIQDKLPAWEDKIFAGQMDIEKAMKAADEEINKEIEKQLDQLKQAGQG